MWEDQYWVEKFAQDKIETIFSIRQYFHLVHRWMLILSNIIENFKNELINFLYSFTMSVCPMILNLTFYISTHVFVCPEGLNLVKGVGH